jgi:L,D-transpeptidase-like protein
MHVIRLLAAPIAAALLCLAPLGSAQARLLIEIDKSSQTMTVSQDGTALHRWPVSTGLRAYDTPSGQYTPFRMEKDHFSREWDDAPMPHSIFFTKQGHAIHGTTHVRAIGRPASHGCVRLDPGHARVLFDMVRREGLANTRVVLAGATPDARSPAVARPYPDERPRYQYGERPSYIGRQPYTGDRLADDNNYPPQANPYAAPRSGYWLQYPDGSRVYVDRERDPRGLPQRPPQGFDAPYGWR